MVKIGEDDRSGLPQEDTWLGSVHLGQGGFGTVHYWLKVDETQNVIDRMVIKDVERAEDTKEPPEHQGIYEELTGQWGNSTWIRDWEATPRPKIYGGVTRRSESLKERVKAGKLDFLNGYPLDWARRYYQLDVDLPIGCDLAFYGNKDPANLNTRAVITPKKPEWDGW